MKKLIPPKLPVLVSDGVVKSVRPDIPPKTVESNLGGRRLCSRYLEHAGGHPQSGIGGYDLDARNPLGGFSSRLGGYFGSGGCVAGMVVEGIDLEPGLVCEDGRGAEVGEEISVGGENVEFILGLFLVLLSSQKLLLGFSFITHIAAIGPGPRGLVGVSRGLVEGAPGNADVEVAEDQLDARSQYGQ